MKDTQLYHLSDKLCSGYIENRCALSLHWEACRVQQQTLTTLEHCLMQALSETILPSSEARRILRCWTEDLNRLDLIPFNQDLVSFGCH